MLIGDRWDIQLWADSAKPVSGKVYRIKVKDWRGTGYDLGNSR